MVEVVRGAAVLVVEVLGGVLVLVVEVVRGAAAVEVDVVGGVAEVCALAAVPVLDVESALVAPHPASARTSNTIATT